MIVRNFLAWSETASVTQRVRAASALARAYLVSELAEAERADAEVAMAALLDDPAAQVRAALAAALAPSPDAPHHIILSLAYDHIEVAQAVLRLSPVLADRDLIECARSGDAPTQDAIASRDHLSLGVCTVLAECAGPGAALLLAQRTQDIGPRATALLVERFCDAGEVREALLARPLLPAHLRAQLVEATARALADFAVGCNWMTGERAARTLRETSEKAVAVIASDFADAPEEMLGLVAHLREAGRLTPALLLRSLLAGDRGLLEAALADLSGFPLERVCALLANWRSHAFRALIARAGLPDWLAAPLRAALAVLDAFGIDDSYGHTGSLRLSLIEPVLEACVASNDADLQPVIAMLRRFQAEAAREAARIVKPEFIASVRFTPAVPALAARPSVQIDLCALEAQLLSQAA